MSQTLYSVTCRSRSLPDPICGWLDVEINEYEIIAETPGFWEVKSDNGYPKVCEKGDYFTLNRQEAEMMRVKKLRDLVQIGEERLKLQKERLAQLQKLC